MVDALPPLLKPELFFALVAPIGVDLPAATAAIRTKLQEFDYKNKEIRVSSVFDQFPTKKKLDESSTFKRYKTAMDIGNEIRETFQFPGILALAASSKIYQLRQETLSPGGGPYLESTCYIINQLKRPEEIEILRRNYGTHLFVFAITSPLQARIDTLAKRIREDDTFQKALSHYEPMARELINRDEDEEDNEYGQRLRAAFAKADFFVEGSTVSDFSSAIGRSIDLIFGKSFISPKRDEFFMNLASNVALQSADLSRQVGAVIVGASDEIIAYGCNEVPRGGGGVYWDGEQEDHRDYTLDSDPNVHHKGRLVQDFLRRIQPVMSEAYADISPAEAFRKLYSDDSLKLEEAHINDLLEFGRVVHAEMNAIAQAAQCGKATKDATLYCTTFPCHICARHIIASGIKKVIYIEPYSKSQAIEQYPESIKVEGRQTSISRIVEFQRFSGVAPLRFANFFSHGKRKTKSGRAKKWRLGEPKPICENHFPVYLDNEKALIKYLARELHDYKSRIT